MTTFTTEHTNEQYDDDDGEDDDGEKVCEESLVM